MTLKKDLSSKLYIEVTDKNAVHIEEGEVELCDYIILCGQKFVRQSKLKNFFDKRYEPGGEFYHLRNETDH